MKRALAIGLSGVALGALGLVGTAGSASAACARTALSTGTFGPGTQMNISSTSPCNDLNLIAADDINPRFTFDRYAGYYKSGNSWIQGASGWHFAADGFSARSSSEYIILISGIRNGALVGVGSERDGGDAVTVAH